MNATKNQAPTRPSNAIRAILCAGLLAGILDITAAIGVGWAMRGIAPIRILQSVASGLLGLSSYEGGYKTATLGLVLHFMIATIWATVFFLLSTRFRFMVRQSIVSGLIFGVAVYLFMNFVVLPLSAFPHRNPVALSSRLIGLSVIIVCVGLPISLIVRRFSKSVG